MEGVPLAGDAEGVSIVAFAMALPKVTSNKPTLG